MFISQNFIVQPQKLLALNLKFKGRNTITNVINKKKNIQTFKKTTVTDS